MEILVSKDKFCELMEKVENAYRAWDTIMRALGVSSSEDEIITGIDGFVDAVSELVGQQNLPAELDADGVMRHCGHHIPLVMWWCWENDFGKNEIDINIKDEIIYPTSTAAHLYDLIVYLNGCAKSESMV